MGLRKKKQMFYVGPKKRGQLVSGSFQTGAQGGTLDAEPGRPPLRSPLLHCALSVPAKKLCFQ